MGYVRDITFPRCGKRWNFAEFGERKRNSNYSENCKKKKVFFKNYSQKIDKICDHEFDKSLLSLSVSDFQLSAELLQSLSELKSVLEVAELSLDSDSEVSRSEFGILMAKFVIFWPRFRPSVHNQHGERKTVFNMCFNGEFYFGKARGSQVSKALWNLHRARHDRKWPISLILPFSEIYGAPRLLKIGEVRERGKTRKITYLQNGFWSLERGKIMSLGYVVFLSLRLTLCNMLPDFETFKKNSTFVAG